MPSGGAAAYRRAAWEAVGGFDEAFFVYGEDLDLGLGCVRWAGRRPRHRRREEFTWAARPLALIRPCSASLPASPAVSSSAATGFFVRGAAQRALGRGGRGGGMGRVPARHRTLVRPRGAILARAGINGRFPLPLAPSTGLFDRLLDSEGHAGTDSGGPAGTCDSSGQLGEPTAYAPYHRHHRAGRVLPRRAPAGEGLRGPRHGAPLLHRDLPAAGTAAATGSPCTPVTCSTSARWSTCCAKASPTRSITWPPCRSWPRRWSQPVLTAEFTATGVTRMLEAMREVGPGGALLPSVVVGDVRQGAGGAAAREARPSIRARPTGWPRSTATGSRSTTASPTTFLPAQGSFSTMRASAGGWSSSPARSPTARPPSSWACRTSCALGNLDAERDWGYARDYVRSHVADAPAGRARRLRDRHRGGEQRAQAGRAGLRARGPRSG